MDARKYAHKRAALCRLNPVDLREHWLRLSRAALLLAAALLVRLTFSTLPAFDIDRVHDVLARALPTPRTRSALLLCQMAALLLPPLGTLIAAIHFLLHAPTPRYPLLLSLFYTAKFLSDASLHVLPPADPHWLDVWPLASRATVPRLLRGNVDGGVGVLLLAFSYFLSLPSSRALPLSACATAALLTAAARLLLRVTHSYALLASLLAAGFAHVLASGLLEHHSPRTLPSSAEAEMLSAYK